MEILIKIGFNTEVVYWDISIVQISRIWRISWPAQLAANFKGFVHNLRVVIRYANIFAPCQQSVINSSVNTADILKCFSF